MIDQLIPLVASCFPIEYLEFWAYPLFMGYFVASVPALIRQFITWR